MLRHILICGDEPSLLETRRLVLLKAGFVVSTFTQAEIESLPQEPAIDLAILGRSFTSQQKNQIAERIADKWPAIKILLLSDRATSLQRVSNQQYISDSIPPYRFIEDCRQLLQK